MAQEIILTKLSLPVDLKNLQKTEKVCILCKDLKPKEAFVRDHTCSDNRRNICRSCEGKRRNVCKEKRKDNLDPEVYFTF